MPMNGRPTIRLFAVVTLAGLIAAPELSPAKEPRVETPAAAKP